MFSIWRAEYKIIVIRTFWKRFACDFSFLGNKITVFGIERWAKKTNRKDQATFSPTKNIQYTYLFQTPLFNRHQYRIRSYLIVQLQCCSSSPTRQTVLGYRWIFELSIVTVAMSLDHSFFHRAPLLYNSGHISQSNIQQILRRLLEVYVWKEKMCHIKGIFRFRSYLFSILWKAK